MLYVRIVGRAHYPPVTVIGLREVSPDQQGITSLNNGLTIGDDLILAPVNQGHNRIGRPRVVLYLAPVQPGTRVEIGRAHV